MSSIAFPDMFNKNSVKVLDGVAGTKNDLELMLQCEKGEELGDPDFGTNLHKTKFQTNVSLAMELAIDGILEAQKYVDNVLFFRENVTVVKSSVSKIDITIEAVFSQATNIKELIVIQGVDIDG